MYKHAVAVSALLFFFVSCSDDTKSPQTDGRIDAGNGDRSISEISTIGADIGAGQAFSFLLSGTQVVPRVTTTGSALGTLTIDEPNSRITVVLNASNIGNITGADLRLGEVGKNGPVLFELINQSFINPLNRTLAASDLRAQPSLGVSNFEEALAAIRGGLTYMVLRTAANTEGELRGQVGVVTLQAQLSSDQEVPAVTSTASAAASVVVAGDQQSITVTLTPKDLVGATSAFIHVGAPGVNGPVIFKISSQAFTEAVTVTLRSTDFTPQPGQGLSNFASAVDAILGGETYINVNTSVHESGEIRGPIGRVVLTAGLNGPAVVPPVTTTAGGTAQISIPNSRQEILVILTFAELSNTTGATIRAAATGANGPIIFVLSASALESPFQRTLTAKDLTPQASAGITNFAEAIKAMITGATYVEITTTTNPEGAVRGQIVGG